MLNCFSEVSCFTKSLIQRCSYLEIGHSAIHREEKGRKRKAAELQRDLAGRLEAEKKRINITERRQVAVGKVTDDS